MLGASPSLRAEAFYNAVNNFSRTSNPSGVWSYGSKASVTTTVLTNYPAEANYPGFTSFDTWCNNASNPAPPYVMRNSSGMTQTGGGISQPPDLLNLHPGPNGERSTVRWTAPYAGTVVIQGRFQGIATGGTTTDVAVTRNGVILPLHGDATASGSTSLTSTGNTVVVPFAYVLTVAAGDVVDFSVGYGNNGNYISDFHRVGCHRHVRICLPRQLQCHQRFLAAQQQPQPRVDLRILAKRNVCAVFHLRAGTDVGF